MKKSLSQESIELLNKGFASLGLTVAAQPGVMAAHPLKVSFINNTDGSTRWIWPADDNTAPFFRFYHAGSRKAQLYVFLVRVCMWLGLGRFIESGRSIIYVNRPADHFQDGCTSWAVFTGTMGQNRKLVAWFKNRKGACFAKLPVSGTSANNLAAETTALRQYATSALQVPGVVAANDHMLVLTDLYEGATQSARHITQLPVGNLQDWCITRLRHKPLADAQWFINAKNTISALAAGNKFHAAFIPRLQQLYNALPAQSIVAHTACHGDFTPWNVRTHYNAILAIDWELAQQCHPALFDIFHFIYQDHILIRRSSFKTIRKAIDEYFAASAWQSFLQQYNIDLALAEKLYLLATVSYYANSYNQQDAWHTQVNWLLQTWFDAMGYWLATGESTTLRPVLLTDISFALRNAPYAVLKMGESNIADLPTTSDIDMCISKQQVPALVAYLRNHHAVATVKTTSSSFMRRITVILTDRSMIHIDCIWKIKRKELVFMAAAEVIANAAQNAFGVKVALPADDARYVSLFYTLNNAAIPAKYQGLVSNGNVASTTKQTAIAQLKQSAANKGLQHIWNTVQYIIDTARDLLPSKGFVMTFSGVDGAGKSTIISHVSKKIEKELRMKVVVLRHRPSLLPILSAWKYGKEGAEQRSMSTLPRTGGNKNSISSLLRFSYYYADYLIGQCYVQLRYVYRGYAVIYDRYYFDFINDGRRSNINLPKGLLRSLYQFITPPDLNYFLFAPADVILARKQELDRETIEALTHSYRSLFSDLQHNDQRHKYTSLCNIDMDQTLDEIFHNIQSHTVCAA